MELPSEQEQEPSASVHKHGWLRSARHSIETSLPYVLTEKALVDTRYTLMVSYIGMMLALVSYIAFSFRNSVVSIFEMWGGRGGDVTVALLEGLDAVMIANFAYLIIVGSYLVYVKPKLADASFEKEEQRPQALQHLSPDTLKQKMAAALVGVTSVRLVQVLLETKLDAVAANWYGLAVIIIIHFALIAGMIAFKLVGHPEPSTHKQDAATSSEHTPEHGKEPS